VERSHTDPCWWQPGDALDTRRRRIAGDVVLPVQLAEIRAPAEVVRFAAPYRRAFDAARRARVAVVDHGIDEQLEREIDLAAVAGKDGEPGGEATTGARARHRDALRVDAELVGVLRGPE